MALPVKTPQTANEVHLADRIEEVLTDAVGRTYAKEIVEYDRPESSGSEFVNRVIADVKETSDYPHYDYFDIHHSIGRVLMDYMGMEYDRDHLPKSQFN